MADTRPDPLARGRNLILGSLLVLAAAAWAVLAWQSATVDEEMAMQPTMGMGAALFVAIWVAMMAAIMFPTAAPMILMFAHVHARKRHRAQPFVPTWVFVGGYMVVWTLLGVIAYVAAVGAEPLVNQSMWLMERAGRFGGALFIVAGLYQLSPLKYRCLAHCRSPLAFVTASWREGYGGAFRMGLEHGVYCAGCCWLLFVLLFPLGMLNIAAMAVITALIFAEKTLPMGRQLSWVAAVALVLYGMVVLLIPDGLRLML